jgi:hypothetical protein
MENLLQQGITAYKAGKIGEARKMFISVVKQSPDSESAWGWMYQISNNDQERIHCLKQILRINPKNEKAKQLLDGLAGNDFPFEMSPKITSSVQEQKYDSSPNIQTEKTVTSEGNMREDKIAEGVSKALEERDARHRKNLIIFFLIMLAPFVLLCIMAGSSSW